MIEKYREICNKVKYLIIQEGDDAYCVASNHINI